MSPKSVDRPPSERGTSSPGRVWLRFGLLVALVLSGVAVTRWSPVQEYLEPQKAVAALEEVGRQPWAPAALIALWGITTPVAIPVSPLVFASGAVFGTFWGWIYSVMGAAVGATTSFWLARLLGHDLLARYLGEERLSRVEELVGRHGFWTVFRLRFVFLPFFLVNFAAALAGMRFGRFLLASLLGTMPALFVYNYFSHALVDATAADRQGVWRNLALAMVAFLVLTLLPQVIARFRNRGPD